MDADLAGSGIGGGQATGLALGLTARLEEQDLSGVANLDAPTAVERRDMENAGHHALR
jgi:NAD dependent epimerase/dehydratase family enzyme